MTPQALLNFIMAGLRVAVPTLQAVLRPFLKATVRVRLVLEIDGPGKLDPLVEVEGLGTIDVDGVRFHGAPSLKVSNSAADLAGDGEP